MENKHIKTFEGFSDIFKSKKQKEREKEKDKEKREPSEKIKKILTDKGWTNIGYDEDHNIIANHKEFGNGVRITDKYLK